MSMAKRLVKNTEPSVQRFHEPYRETGMGSARNRLAGGFVFPPAERSNIVNKIKYSELNARQKEVYNFQKVSAIFAEFGYTTIKLSDDWMGADFIAISFDGKEYLKVQLKGRLTLDKKYQGKNVYVCFCDQLTNEWYLYPHDEALKIILKTIESSKSWKDFGGYSFSYLTPNIKAALSGYRFG